MVNILKYSEDRISLAQEIAETLRNNGCWVPKDWAGPDLIMAVGKALEAQGHNNAPAPEQKPRGNVGGVARCQASE